MKSILQLITAASVIFSLAMLSVSCSKPNEALADNNPNINDRLINDTLFAPAFGQPSQHDSIDLDGDGLKDFFFIAAQDSQGVFRTSFLGVPGLTNLLSDGNGYVSPTTIGAVIDSIPASLPPKPHIWLDTARASLVGPGYSYGEANGTDFYLGVFTTKFDGVHYGWLKLNVAADGRSIRLKELAVYSRPRTAIRAGER